MARKFFTKKILSPGVYLPRDPEGGPPRPSVVTKDKLTKAVESFKRMRKNGILIPAPFRHSSRAVPAQLGTEFSVGDDGSIVNLPADVADDDSYNNGGYWTDLWQDDSGSLWGRMFSDRSEAQERIGTTVTEVSPTFYPKWSDGRNNTYENAITHIALVTQPVEAGQLNFEKEDHPEGALALAMSLMAFSSSFAEVMEAPKRDIAEHKSEPTQDLPKRVSTATISDLLKALKTFGLTLPDDTNGENIVERLLTAILALKSRDESTGEDGSTTSPPDGARTETAGAVTMSKFVEVKNPFDDKAKPIRLEFADTEQFNLFFGQDIQQFSSMANENKSLRASLLTTSVERFKDRIKRLASSGKLTQEYYEKHLAPLLNGPENFSLSDGQFTNPTAEAVLSALEAQPDIGLLQRTDATNFNLDPSEMFNTKPPKGAQSLDSRELFRATAGAPGADDEETEEDKKILRDIYRINRS